MLKTRTECRECKSKNLKVINCTWFECEDCLSTNMKWYDETFDQIEFESFWSKLHRKVQMENKERESKCQ